MKYAVNVMAAICVAAYSGSSFSLPIPSRIVPTSTMDIPVRQQGNPDKTLQLTTAKVAIIIVDMWDQHWCPSATTATNKIALKMAPLLQLARSKGVQIIHAPADVTGIYSALPQYLRISNVSELQNKTAVAKLDSPPLPVDASDGGCEEQNVQQGNVWTQENPFLSLGGYDAISEDGGQIYNYLQQQGIDTLIYMGVHANMCILDRSYGIRQMKSWGIKTMLVRDLTDTMYDSRSYPYVSHDAGTELVVKYIEQNYGPSLTSDAFTAALMKLDNIAP